MSSCQHSGGTAFEVDMGQQRSQSNKMNPVAARLEAEGEKLADKRQSLTTEDINQKLEAAAEKREQLLEEKKSVAKQLEAHPSSASKQQHGYSDRP